MSSSAGAGAAGAGADVLGKRKREEEAAAHFEREAGRLEKARRASYPCLRLNIFRARRRRAGIGLGALERSECLLSRNYLATTDIASLKRTLRADAAAHAVLLLYALAENREAPANVPRQGGTSANQQQEAVMFCERERGATWKTKAGGTRGICRYIVQRRASTLSYT